MCDEKDLALELQHLKTQSLSRRKFGTLAGSAGLGLAFAGCVGGTQDSGADMTSADRALIREDVSFAAPGGLADAFFVYPSEGRHPAVILWPDVRGLRPAMKMMAERLAASGYAVLAVNPYYRELSATALMAELEGLADTNPEAVRPRIFGLMGGTTASMHDEDTLGFMGWLDDNGAVDVNRKAGAIGYCYGGRVVMHSAAAMPERIGAIGSFHGAALVTDTADSPHLRVPEMSVSALIAIAANDDEKQPEAKTALKKAFSDAAQSAEIEVYNAQHGWCALDSRAYNEPEAERAWGRLLALFETALV